MIRGVPQRKRDQILILLIVDRVFPHGLNFDFLDISIMKVKLCREVLLAPLIMTNHIVARQQTLPILNNILFSLKNSRLKITVTDLEIELTTEIFVDTEHDITFTLPARKLTDICKALPNDVEIDLEIKENQIILRSGQGRYTMTTLPADDYPRIVPDTVENTLTISQTILHYFINKTAFAMAQQDVRYYLNGLLLDIQSNKIVAVATDGHRLSIAEATIEHNIVDQMQIILPRKAIIELSRLLGKEEETIQINFSHHYFRIISGNKNFVTKLIDGKFPDYENIMPAKNESTASLKIDKELLQQVLIRTSVLSNEKFCSTRFQIEKNNLYIKVNNSDNYEAEENLIVDYIGKPLEIGFNATYILDILKVIESKDIEILLTSSDTSVLIKSTDRADYCYIVMPMRL